MIFNPLNGSPIKGAFGGHQVEIPVGELRSVPIEAGMVLKMRYPWLHEVVDSPNAAPSTPPPSAVVEEEQKDEKTVDELLVESESETPVLDSVMSALDSEPTPII